MEWWRLLRRGFARLTLHQSYGGLASVCLDDDNIFVDASIDQPKEVIASLANSSKTKKREATCISSPEHTIR